MNEKNQMVFSLSDFTTADWEFLVFVYKLFIDFFYLDYVVLIHQRIYFARSNCIQAMVRILVRAKIPVKRLKEPDLPPKRTKKR